MVFVDRQVAVVGGSHESIPALQAVVERLRERRAVGGLLASKQQPAMQRVQEGLGLERSKSTSLVRVQCLCRALSVVERPEDRQRLLGNEPIRDFVCEAFHQEKER